MLNKFIKLPKNGIRTDCYAAVLKKYQVAFPNAHFEIVMRFPKSVGVDAPASILSPSPKLLAAISNGVISFDTFESRLKQEIFSNPQALVKLREIQKLATESVVFLVCGEKNADRCHRSLLKKWITDL